MQPRAQDLNILPSLRANSLDSLVRMENDAWDPDRTVEDPWLHCAQPVFALQVPICQMPLLPLCVAGRAFFSMLSMLSILRCPSSTVGVVHC